MTFFGVLRGSVRGPLLFLFDWITLDNCKVNIVWFYSRLAFFTRILFTNEELFNITVISFDQFLMIFYRFVGYIDLNFSTTFVSGINLKIFLLF